GQNKSNADYSDHMTILHNSFSLEVAVEKVDPLMTLSTPAVAVCCSRAFSSSWVRVPTCS
ncbi:MAG: hypothetical protein WCF37_07200, partial [Pseudolabrys sp.]